MIAAIARDLAAAMKAKGYPFPVVMGPERTRTVTFGRERVVVEYDEDAGDSFDSTPAHRARAAKFVRSVGAKLTIYAQEPKTGAQDHEHRQRAERALDLVLVELDGVVRGRRNTWAIKSGRFTRPADLEKSEQLAGSVYELTFSVDRAVNDTTWDGAAAPTVAMGGQGPRMRSTTRVSLANGPGADNDGDGVPDDAETSCGGA